MDQAIRQALASGLLVDITTTGRSSGEPRRIEIVTHVFDGRIYISGMPDPSRERAWLLNLKTKPQMTLHLKKGPVADLAATARVISDPAERHQIMALIAQVWNRDPSAMEAHSPLIEVAVDGYGADRAT